MDAPETRQVAIQVRDEDTGVTRTESFPAIVIDETHCMIRNIPTLVRRLSFGDVMARTEGQTSWTIAEKSRYSTILLVPNDDLQTDAGRFILDAQLSRIESIPEIIREQNGWIRTYAVLPEHMPIVSQTLDTGEGALWSWAILSNRSTY